MLLYVGGSSKTSLRRWHLSCYINDAKESQRRESESGVQQRGVGRKQQVQRCKVETSSEWWKNRKKVTLAGWGEWGRMVETEVGPGYKERGTCFRHKIEAGAPKLSHQDE